MPGITLEVGSGSGAVTGYLAKLITAGGARALHFATDVNPNAAAITARTGAANNIHNLEVRFSIPQLISGLTDQLTPNFLEQIVRMDLSSALCRRLCGKVDVLVFNPPYVPTPPEEVGTSSIEAAWAGGLRGREVIDRFLPHVGDLLSSRGRFYLVLVDENRPKEVAKILAEQGLAATLVVKNRAKNENLQIWRCVFYLPGMDFEFLCNLSLIFVRSSNPQV